MAGTAAQAPGGGKARSGLEQAERRHRWISVTDALGARSVAFPAIAAGVYGFPAGPAAVIAMRTIESATTAVGQVRLVAFDQETRDLLEAAWGR
jgi:O-acetyl-ADP-ribose deacetylase (regulator of RNase III)